MASATMRFVSTRLPTIVAAALVGTPRAQCGVAAHGLDAGGGYIQTVTSLPDGGVLVGGDFTPEFTGHGMHVAIWRDGTWSMLGAGVGTASAGDGVMSSAILPNDDMVVGGAFNTAGGQVANSIARWDGSAWHPLGGGITGGYGYTWIDHMVVMPNGDIVVGGRFYYPVPWLARWDGTSWSAIGGGGWEGIEGMAVGPNGDLFVAYNELPGSRVMRWDGATWTQLGAASTPFRVYCLLVTSAGELVAGGEQPAVARWDGTAWVALGSPPYGSQVYALEELPNGDLVTSFFSFFAATSGDIQRWDGAAWQPLGVGIHGLGVNIVIVLDFAWMAHGALAFAGNFASVSGMPATSAAILEPTCAASATAYGTGCLGGAGPVVLTATAWPMLGGVMRGRTSGLTSNSLAVGVFGFSRIQVPLSSGHPLGQPGCDVLVADEILIEFLTSHGDVDSAIEIPLQPVLIGSGFYHQVIPVELDASGAILAITSSNALALTIGSF